MSSATQPADSWALWLAEVDAMSETLAIRTQLEAIQEGILASGLLSDEILIEARSVSMLVEMFAEEYA